ncbi:MAG: DUF4917 family protein [Hyphomicrobiaceae bacterium]
MKLEKFADVLNSIEKNRSRPFHLLLGNGFSMAYDPSIFSYNALHGFVEKLDDDLLKKLFEVTKTRNFEIVLEQLSTFIALLDAFGSDRRLTKQVLAASEALKSSLIDAIRALHPEHVFKVPEERMAACAKFLSTFLNSGGNLYTTNYDLLLYWVLMRSGLKPGDGFGRDNQAENPTEEPEYSELRWDRNKDSQRVFYVHGALPLFDTGVEVIKEQYDGVDYLLDRVGRRIEVGHYPVFVTAGNGSQKLAHIKHNRYLDYCYESLATVTGSKVTFGFGFGESDEHIIEALNRATKLRGDAGDKLWSVYIGVNSQRSYENAVTVATKLKCKVRIYDARTASVWGDQ